MITVYHIDIRAAVNEISVVAQVLDPNRGQCLAAEEKRLKSVAGLPSC
jgi:hypothetical protein